VVSQLQSLAANISNLHSELTQPTTKDKPVTPENNNQHSNNQIDGKGASMAPIKDAASVIADNEPTIDDRGTDQSEALRILTSIRDGAFDSSNEKLALALGRPNRGD
jgi:hypothetical protein